VNDCRAALTVSDVKRTLKNILKSVSEFIEGTSTDFNRFGGGGRRNLCVHHMIIIFHNDSIVKWFFHKKSDFFYRYFSVT